MVPEPIKSLRVCESWQSRGVALISIMLVLAVLSTLLIYAAEDQNLAIRRAENLTAAEQGFQVNLSGEQWVVKVLEKDLLDDLLNTNETSPPIDHVGEVWGNLGPPVEVGETGTTLLMTITDQQGFLNINNLMQGRVAPPATGETGLPEDANSAQDAIEGDATEIGDPDAPDEVLWFQIFQNLMAQLELNPELVDGIIDWVDGNQNPIGTTGAEDFYYSGLELPYRVPDRSISSVGELALIKDFDDSAVDRLLPWLTALPVENPRSTIPVNVNTAPAEVLVLFAANQPQAVENLEPLIAGRVGEPFDSVAAFREQFEALIPAGLVPGHENMLSVTSRFYAGRSCAAAGRVKFSMSSLLEKKQPGNNVKVLRRERFFGCPELSAPSDNSDPPA